MARINTMPVMDNRHIKELLAIMKNNHVPSRKDLLDVLGQVSAMEKQLAAAVGELQAMRLELAEAEKRNHPIKNTLQKAVIAMQSQVLEMRDKLAALKQNVIDGCKNAVEAFKEKGISALDNIAHFFKIKPMLESIRGGLDKNIQLDNKLIANIEAVSMEYHQAGRHLKNMGRAVVGKEAITDAKPPGMVAKAVSVPFRAGRWL